MSEDGWRSGRGPHLSVNQSDVHTFASGRAPTAANGACGVPAEHQTGTFTGTALFGRAVDKRGLFAWTRGKKAHACGLPGSPKDDNVSPGFLFHFVRAMAISNFAPYIRSVTLPGRGIYLPSLVNEAYLAVERGRPTARIVIGASFFSIRFCRTVSVSALHEIRSGACIGAYLTKRCLAFSTLDGMPPPLETGLPRTNA
ncbi:hypothetical protein CGRA01v4_01780 [Colletotrichum graminicola]|nr:hypothetical protein CGRA01v4_01780 [Colletotrichum graminicola]